jgi:hypothetical protein
MVGCCSALSSSGSTLVNIIIIIVSFHFGFRRFEGLLQPSVRFPVLLGQPIFPAISPVQNRIARRYCYPMSESNELSVCALASFFSDIGNCALVASPHFLVTHYNGFGRSTRLPAVLDERLRRS